VKKGAFEVIRKVDIVKELEVRGEDMHRNRSTIDITVGR
jgi:hypothetical protein